MQYSGLFCTHSAFGTPEFDDRTFHVRELLWLWNVNLACCFSGVSLSNINKRDIHKRTMDDACAACVLARKPIQSSAQTQPSAFKTPQLMRNVLCRLCQNFKPIRICSLSLAVSSYINIRRPQSQTHTCAASFLAQKPSISSSVIT